MCVNVCVCESGLKVFMYTGVALTRKNCIFYAKKEQATQIGKCGAFTVRKKQ